MTPAEAANFLGRYATQHHAGAFGAPPRKELEFDPSRIVEYSDDFVAIKQVLTRASFRKDFTGRPFEIPVGSTVATHVAYAHVDPVPLLDDFDVVRTHLDDVDLSASIADQGFSTLGVQVSASAELLGWWHRGPAYTYPDEDAGTVVSLPRAGVPRHALLQEVLGAEGYRDDWPLYSDGTWGALCLKGFYPEDPGKDMKPVEMNRKWKDDNRLDLLRDCEWTTLADDLPKTTAWVRENFPDTERVRLLQMKGKGKLGRHTDIADKAMGTKDGQIVRFHLPILTHPSVELHSWDLTGVKTSTYLEPWNLYYLDARKPHAVTNPNGVNRINLVIDVVCNYKVRDMIADAVAGEALLG